jgi:hypothetical protein
VAVGVIKSSKNLVDIGGEEHNARADRYVALGHSGISTGSLPENEWTTIDATAAVKAILANLDSEYSNFELWPTTGLRVATSGNGSMAGYALSLLGEGTASFEWVGDCTGYSIVDATIDSRMVYMETMYFGNLLVRYQLGNAVDDWLVIHKSTPRAIYVE